MKEIHSMPCRRLIDNLDLRSHYRSIGLCGLRDDTLLGGTAYGSARTSGCEMDEEFALDEVLLYG